MYADRYHSTASRPAGAGAALLISGAMILGLYYAGPTIVPGGITTVLTGRAIELPKPPPKTEPQPKPRPATASRTTPPIAQPSPEVVLPPTGPVLGTAPDPGPVTFDPPGPTGIGSGGGGGITLDPPRAPVLVDASVDPRYAEALQPPYPPSELRAETEGSVTVRVLVGVNGRVKALELVSSPSEAFTSVTRRHAFARWRFKPATRDGTPVESWKRMTLRFRIVE